MLLIYLAILNVFAFLLMWLDKQKAKRSAARISEKTFFITSFMGGSFGVVSGMSLFRHKTSKWTFKLVIGLIIMLQTFGILGFYFNVF